MNHSSQMSLLLAALLIAPFNWAFAQGLWLQEEKVNSAPPVDFADFGTSVAIDEGFAVVGAPDDTSPGSAYVFERSLASTNWTQVRRLTPPDTSNFGDFGLSVAISKDTIAVGDPRSGDGGAIYIFQKNVGGANNWGLVKEIFPSTNIGADIGTSVALWGDTVATGAPDDNEAGSSAGAVFVFDRNEGGLNNWGQTEKLTASDPVNSNNFGEAIDLYGDELIIGDFLGDDAIGSVGLAYIFQRGAAWLEVARLTAPAPQGSAEFGASVGIRCGVAVVGEPDRDVSGTSFQGSAHVFTRDETWTFSQTLFASEPESFDDFGEAVDVGVGTLVIGDSFSDPVGSASGAVYIFAPDASGSWVEMTRLSANDGGSADLLGRVVSVSGSRLIAGAPGDDASGSGTGSAYIFANESWIHRDGFECGNTHGWTTTLSGLGLSSF